MIDAIKFEEFTPVQSVEETEGETNVWFSKLRIKSIGSSQCLF
jgi:hypothetical protein